MDTVKGSIQDNSCPSFIPWVNILGTNCLGASIQVHLGLWNLRRLSWQWLWHDTSIWTPRLAERQTRLSSILCTCCDQEKLVQSSANGPVCKCGSPFIFCIYLLDTHSFHTPTKHTHTKTGNKISLKTAKKSTLAYPSSWWENQETGLEYLKAWDLQVRSGKHICLQLENYRYLVECSTGVFWLWAQRWSKHRKMSYQDFFPVAHDKKLLHYVMSDQPTLASVRAGQSHILTPKNLYEFHPLSPNRSTPGLQMFLYTQRENNVVSKDACPYPHLSLL